MSDGRDESSIQAGGLPGGRLRDAEGAALFLGVSGSAFARHVEPELARVKVGARFMYDVHDLGEWVAAHKAARRAPSSSEPELLTQPEAARLLRVTVRTLSRWVKQGRIRCLKPDPSRQGRVFFQRAALERFLREAESEPFIS